MKKSLARRGASPHRIPKASSSAAPVPFRLRLLSWTLAAGVALAPTAQASPAWEDGKAYTAMLADGGAAALQKVKDAVDNLKKAQDALNVAKLALTGAGGLATSAGAASALANAQAAVAAAEGAVATAQAGAPWVAGALVAAAGGTLIGQGLRGLWSACWDPVCSLHFSGVAPGFYAPTIPAQFIPSLPALTSQATGGQYSLSASDFTAQGAKGNAALAFLTDGATLMIDTAQGAAFAAAGNGAQVVAAATDLASRLITYRADIASFASYLSTATLTSPLPDATAAQAAFLAAVAAAKAACNPAAGDNCAALNSALDAAVAAFAQGNAILAATQFASVAGGVSPYLANLTLGAFNGFLASCAVLGVACLPANEVSLAQTLLADAGTTFAIGPALAAYDATGDIGGEEAALFTGGSLDLPSLLLGSATTLSNCGTANCSWLLITPLNSALVPEPPSWAVAMVFGIGCVLARRRPRGSVAG